MDKKQLSEIDICDKFISPAIARAGWNIHDQIYREFPLRAGRMVVRGNKSHRDKNTVLRADYALFFKANIPIATVEAKDNHHAIGAGMAQAINYAELLNVPFCFSSNGDGFVFRDATLSDGVLEKNLTLEEFPSPQELWERYCAWKGWTPEVRHVAEFDYAPSKTPRYYQLNAINRTVEAIAQGQNRAMLVMATGTGKTYTAFQIIWRLWKSGAKKRILFLADRNILIDQTMVNDFRPFKGAMAKLSPNAKGVERVDATGQITVEDLDIAVNKTTKLVDKRYEIYLSLYQAVTGTLEERNIYKQFSPDFFDLIVVDECHRGSADEDSAWREILTYFNSAAHVGLTATPKETKDISNTDYFGEPMQSVKDFTVPTPSGNRPALEVLQDAKAYAQTADDPEQAEYFVRVKWLNTVDVAKAFNEVGLFGNQNTVCQPRAAKWRHTVERLKTVFQLKSVDGSDK